MSNLIKPELIKIDPTMKPPERTLPVFLAPKLMHVSVSSLVDPTKAMSFEETVGISSSEGFVSDYKEYVNETPYRKTGEGIGLAVTKK